MKKRTPDAPLVPCSECNGTGKVPLPEHLRPIFNKFGPAKELTAHEIHAQDPDPKVTVNAINNRLEALRKYKLLDRLRYGRFWKYSLRTKRSWG